MAPQPQPQCQQQCAAQRGCHGIDPGLPAGHPQQPDCGRVQRKRQQLLEGVHPRPGFGQPAPRRAAIAQQQQRRGHAGAQGDEDQQRDLGRLAQGKTQGGPHERRGAGTGNHHRQDTGKEAAGKTAAVGQSAAGIHQAAAELHQPGEGQAHGDEKVGQGDHEAGRLQLETPANGLAGLLQEDEKRRHQHKAGDYPGAVQPAVQVAVVLRAAGETQHLQRQDGEHAGHQVEDGAPEKGQQQHVQQRTGAGIPGCGRLPGRQRCGAPGRLARADAAGAEVHREILYLRRITQAGVGAALRAQGQGDDAGRGSLRCQLDVGVVVVDLDLAEVFVLALQAGGQLYRQRHLALLVGEFEGKSVPVQVVRIGNLPPDAQTVVLARLDIDLVRLLDRQELRAGGDAPEGRCRRQGRGAAGLPEHQAGRKKQ